MYLLPKLRPNCNNFFKLWLLTWLIPADGHWEHGLSLALDAALVKVEGGA